MTQSLHRRLIELSQTFNRRFNSAYRENIYQMSYLDLARRTEWLDYVPMASPDGGTASFSLLYILLSILRDSPVSHLLEFGVGQTSRLLIQYAQRFQKSLTLIEHDEYWLRDVVRCEQSVTALHARLRQTIVAGKSIRWYDCERPSETFDFVLVDGPMAHSTTNRYNRLGVMNWLPQLLQDEFILIVDDSSRAGESLLVELAVSSFRSRGVAVLRKEFMGATSQTIIVTPGLRKYLFL